MKLNITSKFNHFLLFLLLFSVITCVLIAGENKATDTKDQFLKAISLYYQGDFNQSLELLRNLVKAEPNNENNRINLVRLLREAGELEEALEHLSYLLEHNPNPSYQSAYLTTAYLSGQANIISLSKQQEETAEDCLWKGLTWYDLKDYEQAQNLLERSLQIKRSSLANYFLGLIYLEKKDFQQAKSYLTRSLNEEPNLIPARYNLARTFLELKDYKGAYKRLKQIEASSPWNTDIQRTLKELVTDHPYLIEEEETKKKTSRAIAIVPSAEPFEQWGIPEIKIGLAEKTSVIYVKTGAEYLLSTNSGKKVNSGPAQTILKFVFSSKGNIEVYNEQDLLLLSSANPLVLSYQENTATTLLFNLEFGHGYYWAGSEDRCYRGKIHFLPKPGGLTIVNQLTVEEYLYSVVPSEMPSSWPAPALQAQAVAARTYAFSHLGTYQNRGFDLLSSVSSQAYNGLKNETASVRKAVDATRGQILTFEGKPIAAFYSSNSGGYSTVPPSNWGVNQPYLQTKPDKLLPARLELLSPERLFDWLTERPTAYCANRSNAYRWRVIVPRTEIESRLNMAAQIGQITGVITLGREECGRVKQVLIKGTKGDYVIKGDTIRSKLGGLRSNLFVVEPKLGKDQLPEFFIFTGGGFGHGVGMDQYGAAGMGRNGFSYSQILEHYYSGVELTNIY
jgi:SpoIID/LytB domain protein